MQIQHYEFGEMVIDGQAFTTDLMITANGLIVQDWWREEGHSLSAADLTAVLDSQPRVLVIGTGFFGRMHVPDETRRRLESNDIRLVIDRTGKATEAFNRLSEENQRVAGAFHLTC